MNPQYIPQAFGAPPNNLKPPVGVNPTGQNMEQNAQQQNPYGYKPVGGQMNNLPPNMPPMMNPGNMGQMPPPGTFTGQRLNGPGSMPPINQYQGQIRSPSQNQMRPMYMSNQMGPPGRPMGAPTQMGPPQNQMGPIQNQMGPPQNQMPSVNSFYFL